MSTTFFVLIAIFFDQVDTPHAIERMRFRTEESCQAAIEVLRAATKAQNIFLKDRLLTVCVEQDMRFI